MNLEDEKGFSLVEVVASIVIIAIVLLSFAQIFIQTNRTSVLNNERLVVVNLADAALAKLTSQPIPKQTTTDLNAYFTDTSQSDNTKKNPPTEIQLNGQTYTVTYTPSQDKESIKNSTNTESSLDLIKVVVTVTAPNGKTKGSSEGYVYIE